MKKKILSKHRGRIILELILTHCVNRKKRRLDCECQSAKEDRATIWLKIWWWSQKFYSWRIARAQVKKTKIRSREGTVRWNEVKVVVLRASKFLPGNLLLIMVLNNFWYFQHQTSIRICSEASLKHNWRFVFEKSKKKYNFRRQFLQ